VAETALVIAEAVENIVVVETVAAEIVAADAKLSLNDVCVNGGKKPANILRQMKH
jgi:hypothetical protein